MSEYKEIRFRLYFNMEKEEHKNIYEVLTGCQSATERNKLLMQILENHFTTDDLTDVAISNNTEKSTNEDERQVIDYLYEHIRSINERLNMLEKTASEPKNDSAGQFISDDIHNFSNNTGITETEVISMEISDTQQPEPTADKIESSPDIEIPDDILDYLNSLK